MITLTDKQLLAALAAGDFFKRSPNQVFQMHGAAGSGKTTILKTIAEEHPSASLCAYTGKAASVLRAKTGLAASTVHSLFYRLVDKVIDPESEKVQLRWSKIHVPGSLRGQEILLDESSMISEVMAADLIASGAKILAVGDPGQLPPVMGKQAFRRPDLILTEIHRQAAESPIIRQATQVRANGVYRNDTDDFRVVRGVLPDDLLIGADVILCHKNTTRHALNNRIRRLRGLSGYPKAGEPMMCLKNLKSLNLYNGALYTLGRDIQPDDRSISILLPEHGQSMEIDGAEFAPAGTDINSFPDNTPTAFSFGYAMTVHKSQGSEWPNVLLVDEYNLGESRYQWLYTGITRAANSIVVQRA